MAVTDHTRLLTARAAARKKSTDNCRSTNRTRGGYSADVRSPGKAEPAVDADLVEPVTETQLRLPISISYKIGNVSPFAHDVRQDHWLEVAKVQRTRYLTVCNFRDSFGKSIRNVMERKKCMSTVLLGEGISALFIINHYQLPASRNVFTVRQSPEESVHSHLVEDESRRVFGGRDRMRSA